MTDSHQSPASRSFTLTTWNTNFDRRAKIGSFSWDARKEAVVSHIMNFGTDFVCLQELRDDAVCYIMASPIITAKYDIAYARTNATDDALCLVTLFDKKKCTCASQPLWFGRGTDVCEHWTELPLGNGYGRMMLETRFYSAVAPDPKAKAPPTHESTPLRIYNVHLGLGEPERMLEAGAIHQRVKNDLMKAGAAADCRIIVCGDFNSFADAGGKREVDLIRRGESSTDPVILLDTEEYGRPIVTTSMGPSPGMPIAVCGTQISYPYDTWIKFKGTDHEEIHPIEGEMGGHLDHIFHTTNLTPSGCSLYTHRIDGTPAVLDDFGFHKQDVKPRFPSDHLPLMVKFSYN